MTLPSPLPANWANESVIRYTATILDKPEYTDSKTIVRKGIWYIRIKGYKEIIPGSRVIFEGEVEPKWVLGKVVQIKMVEPKITGTKYLRSRGAFHPQAIMIALGNLREKWVATLQKTLPEPMASLAAGILLGIKGQMPQDFYQALVNTGTLHIVAASGYNVSIVAEVLMKMTGGLVSRAVGIWVGVIGIGLYVVIAGGSASVVRAGIMGSLTLVAYYFGRPSEARRLLWVTAFLMLTYNPLYIVDVGFQLSFVATAGLLDLEPWIVGLHSRSVGALHSGSVWEPVGKFLSDYLYPTLAATVATLPIIWWHFGRVSLISPFVNILVLPFVPLMMGMTVATLFGGQVVAWMTYPILAYMVWMIRLWG
jgi:competence protein ComEC